MRKSNWTAIGILFFFFLGSSLLSASGIRWKLQGRKAFIRNEKNAFLKILVEAPGKELSRLELSGSLAGFPIKVLKKEKLAAKEKFLFHIPVETRLSVGKYPIRLTVKGKELKTPVKISAEMMIGPEIHDRMMVLCDCSPFLYPTMQELGFTHAALNWWRSDDYCDKMLFAGFRGVDRYHFLNRDALKKLPYLRMDPNGKPYEDTTRKKNRPKLNVAHPEFQKAAAALARKRGERYADFPAIEGVNINTEWRDSTLVSFDPHSREAFRKYASIPIPPEVKVKEGVHYSHIKNFPVSRVIPDNDPLLTFYRWFWKDGDGYNPLNSVMVKGYKEGFKRPVWFSYDPAVRVPPLWGSGGNVNRINHWTVAIPDPLNIGVVTSELQAMADGDRRKKIFSETQLIVYRSGAAPIGMKVSGEPAWVKKFPRAPYVTLAPDLLEIALWVQISREVSAIAFYGIDSLLQDPNPRKRKDVGLQCTNHQSAEVFKKFIHKVVRPLGPVLKRIPERKREVAVLESFASSIYAQKGTWGWCGSPAFKIHLALLWANLAPKVVYDETILRDKLAQIRVLILPQCDVLTEKVFHAITDFQEKGGVVVGDRFLVPGITPDITLEDYRSTLDPVKDKKALQRIGTDLRKRIRAFHKPYVSTSDPDLVTWVRSSGKADYLFVVNDKRTFGDYFGPYKKVMEKSVDNRGTVTLRRADTAAVYDLVNHCEVPFRIRNGKTLIHTVHDRNSIGKILLLLPEKTGKIHLEMPYCAEKGETIRIKVSLSSSSGKKIKTLHPIVLEVRDAAGKQTGDSASGALENGVYTQKLTIPLNAAAGTWKILARDLASGKSLQKTLLIR